MNQPVSREVVVEQATRALLELNPTDLLSAVGVREICRRAGISSAALYRQFGSLAGLADAVVAHVFDPNRLSMPSTTATVDIGASPLPLQTALDFHRADFDRLRNDPELRLRLGLWGLGGETTTSVYGDFLRRTEEPVVAGLATMLASWGRQVRLPFDRETFIAFHVALTSGAAVRSIVDPEMLDRDDFARTAAALSRVLLRVEGDQRTIDDRLTEFNYFPLHDPSGHKITDRGRVTRARILDAAAELFGYRSVDSVSLADVAKSAGVGRSTVYGLFEDVNDVAVQVLLTQAADVIGRVPDKDLDSILIEMATFLLARLPLCESYAARLASTADSSLDPIVQGVIEQMNIPDANRAHTAVLVLVSTLIRRPSAGIEPPILVANAVLTA